MRWFKHLSMAHNDTEMSAVLEELGAEAYGVWWLILEDVASCMDKNSSAAIAIHSDVKWSQICYCSARKLRSIVSRLNEKGLISATSTDNRLQIEVRNLLKYRDEYSKKSGVAPDSRADTDTHTDTDTQTEQPPTPLCADTQGGIPSRPKASASVPAVIDPHFDEWWNGWSSVRGTNHKSQAEHAWMSVVRPENVVALFECTASYLASLDTPTKGYNPENFLFEQARDGFTARFPPRQKREAAKIDIATAEFIERRKRRHA